ncbi:MAG: DUF4900 domain-containing protein, partial [Pleurocapsa sp. SU_196_0]|nr:DUF4900 domain-containing protein [Pleurocapsa sp. SU_196_0]
MNLQKTRGVAIVVVLISAVVFMGIVIAITGTLSLSSRGTTADQRVSLEAQYASESGLSRINAEAQSGLLKTWSQLIFRMQTEYSTTSAEIQQLASQFCNLTTVATPPTTTPSTTVNYCNANNTGSNVANRFAVFSQYIPLAAYTDTTITPAPVPVAPATVVPATLAQAETYWQDVFSNGPSGVRYTNVLRTGIRYNVNFGLEAQRVDIDNKGAYVFVFRVRDSSSTGSYTANGKEVSTRTTTRTFPRPYMIRLEPPTFASFLSFTDKQVVAGAGNNTRVFFNSSTLLDGPVFTNGSFYFTGKPWLSNTVSSAGCVNGYDAFKNCVGTTNTAYYNDGGTDLSVTVNGTQAEFTGYGVGAPSTNTSPEFVLENFDKDVNGNTLTTYTKDANPNPWKYTGRYSDSVVPFPTNSANQRVLAQTAGILLETAANPAVGQYYDSPAPSVLMQATTTGRTTSTSFNTVPNNGTAATYQLIRVQAKQKISRCRAAPVGLVINPLVASINTLGTQAFNATVDVGTPTFENAAASNEVTWSLVSAPAGVSGTLAPSGAGNLTGTYTSTNGATPSGQTVVLRASHPSGLTTGSGLPNTSADAKLTITGIAPVIGNVGTDQSVNYKQPGANRRHQL